MYACAQATHGFRGVRPRRALTCAPKPGSKLHFASWQWHVLTGLDSSSFLCMGLPFARLARSTFRTRIFSHSPPTRSQTITNNPVDASPGHSSFFAHTPNLHSVVHIVFGVVSPQPTTRPSGSQPGCSRLTTDISRPIVWIPLPIASDSHTWKAAVRVRTFGISSSALFYPCKKAG
jgi:hypothetical protein